MSEYRVVDAGDLTTLCERVNEALREGWRVTAGFAVLEYDNGTPDKTRRFCQPMVRNDKLIKRWVQSVPVWDGVSV